MKRVSKQFNNFQQFVSAYIIFHLSKDKKLKKLIEVAEAICFISTERKFTCSLCASILSQQLSTKVARVLHKRFLDLIWQERTFTATNFGNTRLLFFAASVFQTQKHPMFIMFAGFLLIIK